MLNLLHFYFFINFVCATSRLIDVVCMCVSNEVVKRKTYECLIFLPIRKLLSKKKHVADYFLLKFQDEDKRFINIYHFGIEPMGFQTPLTLELLSKIIINPDSCKGKYPHVNVVNESVNKLFETCSSKEKQNNLQILKTYSNLYACAYTKFSRDSLKCALCGLCKVLLPVSLVVHKCIAQRWGMLRECTLGSYRVLRFYQHKYN